MPSPLPQPAPGRRDGLLTLPAGRGAAFVFTWTCAAAANKTNVRANGLRRDRAGAGRLCRPDPGGPRRDELGPTGYQWDAADLSMGLSGSLRYPHH